MTIREMKDIARSLKRYYHDSRFGVLSERERETLLMADYILDLPDDDKPSEPTG